MLDLKAINKFIKEVSETRGINKEELFEAIEESMAVAYKKEYGARGQVIRAKIDPETGEVDFFRIKEVIAPEQIISDEDFDKMSKEEYLKIKDTTNKVKFIDEKHILLDTAKLIKNDVKVGDELVFDLERKEDFGRLAAMSAKQAIKKKMREAERAHLQKEFGELVGEIVYGKVLRDDDGTYIISLEKNVEAVLPYNEQIRGEKYKTGDSIKAYLIDTYEHNGRIELRLSRTHPEFLRKLFEIEVPELKEGLVEIKKIVREPGKRSKVSVESYTDNLDPVGTLVGPAGKRSSVITAELSGEKIDVVEYFDNPEEFIKAALSPAEVLDIEVDEEKKYAKVVVPTEQISLAIGRGGQNARLVAKLTTYKLDIVDGKNNKKDDFRETQDEQTESNDKREK